MGNFAKVIDKKVKKVIVAEPEFFDTFVDSTPGVWLQVSYNTRGNVHYGKDGKPDGGIPLRGNYPAIGDTYDAINDVFYAPQPFPSWSLNSNWVWQPPVPMPTDDKSYQWDESTETWVEQNV